MLNEVGHGGFVDDCLFQALYLNANRVSAGIRTFWKRRVGDFAKVDRVGVVRSGRTGDRELHSDSARGVIYSNAIRIKPRRIECHRPCSLILVKVGVEGRERVRYGIRDGRA